MSEPGNHTIHVRQDIRTAVQGLSTRLGFLDAKVDRNHTDMQRRMNSLQQAINGESVLGRYAVAEVEDRLTAIEGRLSALESQRD